MLPQKLQLELKSQIVKCNIRDTKQLKKMIKLKSYCPKRLFNKITHLCLVLEKYWDRFRAKIKIKQLTSKLLKLELLHLKVILTAKSQRSYHHLEQNNGDAKSANLLIQHMRKQKKELKKKNLRNQSKVAKDVENQNKL